LTTTRGGSSRWVENRPARGLPRLDLHELWAYRELAGFLALRDLKVRYKQAVFGIAWAIVQPLATVAVFTIVFNRLASVQSEGIPYPVFALAGLTLWTYVSNGVNRATLSLVGNPALVTKVYFPRILAPIASVLPATVDLVVSLVLLGILIPVYGVALSGAAITLPIWVVGATTTAIGVGLIFGTLNVRYRDVNQAIAFFIQLWLFLSPVAYATSSVPENWRMLFSLNPMVGWIDGLRWAMLGAPWPGLGLLISVVSSLVILTLGVAYFQTAERRFADVI
jgi:ABC-type polysaccharide/polyol phosphate export permease